MRGEDRSPGKGLQLSSEARAVLERTRNLWSLTRQHIRQFAPRSVHPRLQVFELLAACIYVIDDVADGSDAVPSEAVLRGSFLPWLRRPAVGVECSRGVREILHLVEAALRGGPAAWHSQWRAEGERLLAAMWQERLWSRQSVSIELDDYLLVGAESISTQWMAMAIACLVQPPVSDQAISRYSRAAHAVAVAIRLANDLATHEREAEARDINAVALWQRPQAGSPALAIAAIEARRDAAFAEARQTCAREVAPWPELRATLEAVLRVVGGFLHQSDYARLGVRAHERAALPEDARLSR